MPDLPRPSRVWVVVPTYNERENLAGVLAAVLTALPEARVLVVDDNSPDGTGDLADQLAAADPRVQVLHRAGKAGLGAAYRAGFGFALGDPGAGIIVQMDCDFSHDPVELPRLLSALADADLAIGSRYVPHGSVVGWSTRRLLISRGGSLFARAVLWLPYHDLTGGFKAWRRDLLVSVMDRSHYAGGYGFQVETTWQAHRAGARIVEVPITFRDRVAGASKMSGRIVREALVLVLRLRLTTLLPRYLRRANP